MVKKWKKPQVGDSMGDPPTRDDRCAIGVAVGYNYQKYNNGIVMVIIIKSNGKDKQYRKNHKSQSSY